MKDPSKYFNHSAKRAYINENLEMTVGLGVTGR